MVYGEKARDSPRFIDAIIKYLALWLHLLLCLYAVTVFEVLEMGGSLNEKTGGNS